MSAMVHSASQASSRVPYSPAGGKTFGGNPFAGKGATPYAFVGEPVAMEQPVPHSFGRFPATPMAHSFARSRSPAAYRPGAGSITVSGGALPPMAQLASPRMHQRTSTSPVPDRRQAPRGAPMLAVPSPGVAMFAQPAPNTSRAPSRAGSVIDSARNAARRSASYETPDGGRGVPARPYVQRMPSPLTHRHAAHQSMPSMPTAQVGPVPVPLEVVPSSARTAPNSARQPAPQRTQLAQRLDTPKGPQQAPPQTQLAQPPREPIVPSAVPQTPKGRPQVTNGSQQPTSVQTLHPQQRQPPTAGVAPSEQLLPQTPLASMTSMPDGIAVGNTQLLHEIVQEVRSISGGLTSATSPGAVGTPPVASGTPNSKDGREVASVEHWNLKYQELTKREQDLQEKVRELADLRDRLEARSQEQEQEHASTAKKAAEQVKNLEEQKESLESELQTAQRSSQARAALEQQVQSLIAQSDAIEAQAKQREEELRRHLNDAAQATQRLEEEKRAARVELEATVQQLERSRQVEREVQEMQRRNQELERNDQDMQAQVRTLNGLKANLASQMEEREHELANRVSAAVEQARRAEGEKQAMQDEAQRARLMVDQAHREAQQAMEASREELRALQAHSAGLEEQLRHVGDMPRMLEQEKQAMESNVQWSARRQQEVEQENNMLRKTAFELKHQLQLQDQAVAANLTPGDFFRMMKSYESESLCFENGRLKRALHGAQCELEACQRTIAEQDALIKELHSGRRR